jgi:poly-gamma-glutamate synthesis protein (capsule biosynthesis protein)
MIHHILKATIISVLLFFQFSCQQEKKISICFTGDVLLDRDIENTILSKGENFLFAEVQPILSQFSFRVINLECPITSIENPLEKEIIFKANYTGLKVLKSQKITHVGLANNHINDHRFEGAKETYMNLLNNGMIPIGWYPTDSSYCQPTKIEKENQTILIYAAMQLDVSDEEKKNICLLEDFELFESIKIHQKNYPNVLIVGYLHWGIEYHQTPSEKQIKYAHKLIDAGVDIVIGHHPHVVQSIDFYKNKPIFYSLGNFIFDQHQPNTKKGIVLGVEFSRNQALFEILPYKITKNRPEWMVLGEKDSFKKSILNHSKNILLKETLRGWKVEKKQNPNNDSLFYIVEQQEFPAKKIEDKYLKASVSLKKLNHQKGYRLEVLNDSTKKLDALKIEHPIFHFELFDIDQDEQTNILIGVIKKTHFEPVLEKRINILRIDDGQIRPLWLGSKVCFKLIDFKGIKIKEKNYILTLEQDSFEIYYVGLYEWQGFGLRLKKFLFKNQDFLKSSNYFNHEKVF